MSNGRMAAKCAPEVSPVTVSCRNHRNKTVKRDRPQSTRILQLQEQQALSQELEVLRDCGDLAGETSDGEGLVFECDGDN